jgi:hypothetical protein
MRDFMRLCLILKHRNVRSPLSSSETPLNVEPCRLWQIEKKTGKMVKMIKSNVIEVGNLCEWNFLL